VSGSVEGRYIEFVDHLHEHFAVPVDVRAGRYWPPTEPGAGTEMRGESITGHLFAG
jgi:L-fuconate dehydratase